eukprot:scaffold12262_cov121-Isochrysis_galbana.AAC.13
MSSDEVGRASVGWLRPGLTWPSGHRTHTRYKGRTRRLRAHSLRTYPSEMDSMGEGREGSARGH